MFSLNLVALFAVAQIQNASFTKISRSRNSGRRLASRQVVSGFEWRVVRDAIPGQADRLDDGVDERGSGIWRLRASSTSLR